MMIPNLNARDKITRARVLLQDRNPFFSYLAMSLEIIEDKNTSTCGVDCKGKLYYNPEWIDKLSVDETQTLLTHEVMHVALAHMTRKGEREMKTWNIANDIIVNNLLSNNGFSFTGGLKSGAIPTSPNEIKRGKLVITELDKKASEEVYAIISKLKDDDNKGSYGNEGKGKPKDDKQNSGSGSNGGNSEGKGKPKDDKQNSGSGSNGGNSEGKEPTKEDLKGFDKHIHAQADEKDENGKSTCEQAEKEWRNKLAEAVVFAKSRGTEPRGMGRYIDELLNVKMNWKQILQKYITSNIPNDYTYARASRRSASLGVFLPAMKKEALDIAVFVDTSGSIGKDELTEFVTEIDGIGRGFDNVKIELITWDAQAHERYTIGKSELSELTNIEISGGGGTDFRDIYEYLERENIQAKVVIFFTDGYASFSEDNERYKTLWVLTQNSVEESRIPYGEVIKL